MSPYLIRRSITPDDPQQRYLDMQQRTSGLIDYLRTGQPADCVETDRPGQLPFAPVSHYLWSAHTYRPRAAACCAWYDKGLTVLLAAGESNPKVSHTQHQDAVYEDSCLEFFVCPDPARSQVYLNFELNARGALLLEHGRDRVHRQPFDSRLRDTVLIKTARQSQPNPFWSVYLDIPTDLLLHPLKAKGLEASSVWAPGHQMTVNFYKCGDKTDYPHYGCWHLINSQQPDFHRPADFGSAKLV